MGSEPTGTRADVQGPIETPPVFEGWNEERLATLRRLWNEGAKVRDIAAVVGCSSPEASKRAHREGLPRRGLGRRKPHPVSLGEMDDRLHAMRGCTLQQMADNIGVSRGVIWKRLNHLKPRP